MATAITSFIMRARNYVGTVLWCLALFVRGAWPAAVAAFAVGMAAPALQGLSVVILSLLSADFLGEQGFNIPILSPFIAALPLVLRVALLLAALVAASLCYFLGRWLYIQIGARSFANWLEELLAARSFLPDPRRPEASWLLLQDPNGLLRGARRSSVAAIQIAEVLPKVLAAVFASAVLVTMQPVLMLLAFALFGLAALFLVPNMKSATTALARLQTATAKYRTALKTAPSGQLSAASSARAKAVRKAFAGRYLVGPIFALILGIGIAVAITAAVVFVAASKALNQHANLAALVVFVGTLQIALTGYSKGLSALANLSRFYDAIQQFKRFRIDCDRALERPLGDLQAKTSVHLTTKRQPQGLSFDAAAPLALVGARSIDEALAALLSARTEQERLPLAAGRWDGMPAGQQRPKTALRLAWSDNPGGGRKKEDAEQSVSDLSTDADHPGLVVVHRDVGTVGGFGEQTLGLVRAGQLIALSRHGEPSWDRLLKAARRKQAAIQGDDEDDDGEGD